MDQEIKQEFSKIGDQFSKIDDRFIKMDDRFAKMDKRFERIDERFEKMDERFEKMDDRFEKLAIMINKGFELTATKEELMEVKNQMATKVDLNKHKLEVQDFINDKLADLKGDLVILTRKEDKKLLSLAEILYNKKVLNKKELNELTSLEPFPRVVV